MKRGNGLQKDLEQIFDSERIAPAEGRVPARFTVFPTESKQICELVSLARKEGITLVPVGGTTQLYPPPQLLDVAVSLSRLDGTVQHNPHDLTATAPAGLPFAELQKALAEQGQMLPLDSRPGGKSTLGGILSANRPGPLRHRYGSARDWVLGTTVVNGHGEVSRSGGKVVKNVSGYDLNKLYIGGRGTLGILTGVSFKLHPLPEAQSTWGARAMRVADVLDAAASFRRSPVILEGLVIANGKWVGESPDSRILMVKVAGSRTNLITQERTLISHLEGFAKNGSIARGEEAETLWERIHRSLVDEPDSPGPVATVFLGIKGLRTLLGDDALRTESGPAVRAYPGAGVCTLSFASNGEDPSQQFMIDTVRKLEGIVEFEILPPDSTAERWPILPSSLPWMKKVKKALDPDGVFAPGTFVGGI